MRPVSVPVSVEGYIGLPGSGKTYGMTRRGVQAMAAGRTVFSNYGVKGTHVLGAWDHANPDPKLSNPPCECGSCFVSISDAMILIDEVNLWAPSRYWANLPLALLHRWAQVRKYGIQVIWSAQHEARVDKALREVTGWMWQCEPVLLRRWFRYTAFEPSDLRKSMGVKALDQEYVRLRPDIASAYDTFAILGVGSHLGDVGGRPATAPAGGGRQDASGESVPRGASGTAGAR